MSERQKTRLVGLLIGGTVIFALIVGVALFLFNVSGQQIAANDQAQGNQSDEQSAQANTSDPEVSSAGEDTSESDSQPRQYTKEQFEKAVLGKTKAEIRSQFGSPREVFSPSEWYYFRPPVYDAEAGTPAESLVLEFYPSVVVDLSSGKKCDGGAEECVGGVRY